MSQTSIRHALIAGYRAALPALASDSRTAYENRSFSPPNGQDWARVVYAPNDPAPTGLGSGGTDYIDGALLISLFSPIGSGESGILGNFELLRAYFHAGRYLTHDGQTAVVRYCGRGSGRTEGSFYMLPVTVAFYAQIQRS